ncbi:MAG TPA: peptide chain release factor 1 [bacterium]|nr:peptide chain release factor 1 [bacterium]
MLEILDSLQKRFADLESQLADPATAANPAKLRDLGREHRRLSETVTVGETYRRVLREIEGNAELVADGGDPELVEMAREDLKRLESERAQLEERLRDLLTPPDPNDSKAAIVEIRAGTGGDEAALFAADLMRMYLRYVERKGWKVEMLGSNETGVGGFKEVAFSVEGEEAYGTLKFESGVHRVQRVPVTEASGRIHTSAATVAVLPEAEEVDIDIRPEDLRIDVFRSSGPGGQSVNTTDSAVRITHIPTGTVVQCQDEKSQLKNKNKAMKVLRARLLAVAQEAQNAKLAAERKQMVSTGDRSAKIRTYNFPQNRVTDHRIGLTLQSLDRVINGDLEEIIEALKAEDRKQRLSQSGSATAA